MRSEKESKLGIISAFSLKRRFGGYIFVEVRREKDRMRSLANVRRALEGMSDAFLGKAEPIRDEDYENLFK